MDIQICQSCGIIIRGKSKFCTGCGTTISKFSPVTLPVISHTTAPLAVTLDPDPLVLERTMVKVRYGNMPTAPGGYGGDSYDAQDDGNGYGNDGNGNSGYGDGNESYAPPGSAQTAPSLDHAGQAAAASSSKLQNILGNAASRGVTGGAGGGSLVSYGDEEEEPAYQGAAFAPDHDSANQVAMQFTPGNGADMHDASDEQTASNSRIVATAGAFDALAGSTALATSIPVTVTNGTNPSYDAGSVVARALDSTPTHMPITSAEPPTGAYTASSAHATTVVAPQTGSPETVPLGQDDYVAPARDEFIPEPQTFEPEPVQEAKPLSFESPNSSPAANLTAPPEGDFFNSSPAGEPTTELPPPVVAAAEQAPPAVTQAPELIIAAPLSANAPAVEAPLVVQPPVTAQPTSNPAPLNPGSFDFFAPQSGSFQAPAQSTQTETQAAQPAVRAEQNVLDTSKFSSGVPSVVQDAIRAAASASQTTNLGLNADDEKTTILSDDQPKAKRNGRDEDFPDESVKRKKKLSAKNQPEESDTAMTSARKRNRARLDRDDEDENSTEEGAPRSSDKKFTIGGNEFKLKTVIIAAVLLLFVGLPGIGIFFTLLGKATGGGAPTSAILGGDWSMGALLPNGQNLKATVNLQQNGSTFSGNGVDTYGYFMITNGQITFDKTQQKVQFAKVYVDDQRRPKGKPITYAGVVDWINPDPNKGNVPFFSHMYGVWQFNKRDGYGWRAQSVTKSGKWEAGQIRVDKTGAGSIPQAQGAGLDIGRGIKDLIGVPDDPSPAKMSVFFVRVAGMLLLLGLGIVLASAKMFGPSGMLNIWLKKEYIPSQFKSQHNKMVRDYGKPLKTGGMPLGWRADWNVMQAWMPRSLALPPDVRAQNPHMMVLGAGSKGKSRLIGSMIMNDIESNDRAVIVIDSDGGLVDLLLAKIAASPKGGDIAKRLIVIDPTHGGDVFAYNPLEYPDDGDLQNAASAVVFGFKAIYTEPPGSQSQWNQQTANILRNSAILLMANGKTLTDLPVLLSENDFRDVLLEKIERLKHEKAEYTTLLEAWNQYKRLARTDQWINWVEPILNRVQPMLGDPRIRPILTKPKGDLNLKEIISEGKILFVKVPQGQLDQNANLLGSMIVTGAKQAAMSLSLKGSSRKHQCAMYLDEFDNFIEKETFDAITSETKKVQIGFIGSSKTLQGLPEDYRNQIVINVGTMACFALAKKDGDMLGPSMFRVDGRKIKHQTLQNIFNKVNTAPQFELISDEEKLNIDRVVGQEERHYFCYRVGTVAGVFAMRAPDFADVPDKDVNWTLIDQIYARSVPKD